MVWEQLHDKARVKAAICGSTWIDWGAPPEMKDSRHDWLWRSEDSRVARLTSSVRPAVFRVLAISGYVGALSFRENIVQWGSIELIINGSTASLPLDF